MMRRSLFILLLVAVPLVATPLAAADIGVGVPVCDDAGHCKCFNVYERAPGPTVDKRCYLTG